jgi:ketosteroid isomerase-like protein
MRQVSDRVEWRVAFLAGVIFAAAATAGAQDAAVRSAIEAANKKFSAAAAKADAAALGGMYTADAEAFPPNADVVKGRAAIQAMWKSVLDSGVTGLELATVGVEAQGNLAAESGTYVIKVKDGAVGDKGKYVVVWKKVGGQWMIHRDIWNTSQPPPPPRP